MKLLTREALLSFRRAPLLSTLSITTIAFSLFTLGLFGLVAINLREALRGLEERVEIVAFVLRGTPGASWWSSATRTATCRSIRCRRRSRCGSRAAIATRRTSSEWRSGSGDSASSTTSASAASGCRSWITFGTSRASSDWSPQRC